MAEHCLLRGLLGATVSDVSAKVCHDCKQGNKTKISGKCKIINNKANFKTQYMYYIFVKDFTLQLLFCKLLLANNENNNDKPNMQSSVIQWNGLLQGCFLLQLFVMNYCDFLAITI